MTLSKPRILLVGYGKIGARLAYALRANHLVSVLKRSPVKGFENIDYIWADVSDPRTLPRRLGRNVDYVVYCLSPPEGSDAGYRQVFVEGLRNLLASLDLASVKRFFFVSSTSVYHQDDESIVDETSETKPRRYSGQRLLEGEQLLNEAPVPSTVIRFSGIYGCDRTRMIQSVLDGQALKHQNDQYTNRIHEDDCVGFLLHLLELAQDGKKLDDCYLASDSLPVKRNTFLEQLGQWLNRAPQSSDTESKVRAGSKRCSNARMLASGYDLLFPSYLEGYPPMIKEYLGAKDT